MTCQLKLIPSNTLMKRGGFILTASKVKEVAGKDGRGPNEPGGGLRLLHLPEDYLNSRSRFRSENSL
jgi:hypothetical protein